MDRIERLANTLAAWRKDVGWRGWVFGLTWLIILFWVIIFVLPDLS